MTGREKAIIAVLEIEGNIINDPVNYFPQAIEQDRFFPEVSIVIAEQPASGYIFFNGSHSVVSRTI